MGEKSRKSRKKSSESDIENVEGRVHKQLKHGALTDEQSVTSVSSISSTIVIAAYGSVTYCARLIVLYTNGLVRSRLIQV